MTGRAKGAGGKDEGYVSGEELQIRNPKERTRPQSSLPEQTRNAEGKKKKANPGAATANSGSAGTELTRGELNKKRPNDWHNPAKSTTPEGAPYRQGSNTTCRLQTQKS